MIINCFRTLRSVIVASVFSVGILASVLQPLSAADGQAPAAKHPHLPSLPTHRSPAAGKEDNPQCCKTDAVDAKSAGTASRPYKKFEVTGEVVDTWCFASKVVRGGRGPAHYECADACAHGGVTLGIVDDAGTLYIASKTRAYQGCQHLLEPFVARRVVATGWLAQAGGCNIMKIDKIKLATDKPQPKLPIDK